LGSFLPFSNFIWIFVVSLFFSCAQFYLSNIVAHNCFNESSILNNIIDEAMYDLMIGTKVSFTFLSRFFFYIFITLVVANISNSVVFCNGFTPQFFMTLHLSYSLFITLVFYEFFWKFLKFSCRFLPGGVPQNLEFLVLLIDLFSYIGHIFSLFIRLSANMLSGMVLASLMNLGFYSLLIIIHQYFNVPHFLFFFILVSYVLLELFIAILQSYVFVLLAILYTNEAFTDH
jgi:F-type H+-transporting ATPase subunit a